MPIGKRSKSSQNAILFCPCAILPGIAGIAPMFAGAVSMFAGAVPMFAGTVPIFIGAVSPGILPILSGMLPIPSRTLPLPDGIDVSAGIHGVRPDWREFDSDRGCIIVGGIPQGGYP